MKKALAAALIMMGVLSTGCAQISPRDNVSPRLQQDINNQNGKIERLENNQNSLRAQIDKISLINKENNNTGIQILQGDGALFLIFAVITLFVVCCYFYKTGSNYQKMAEILAQEINSQDDPDLKEKVLKAAQHTEIEQKICRLIRK